MNLSILSSLGFKRCRNRMTGTRAASPRPNGCYFAWVRSGSANPILQPGASRGRGRFSVFATENRLGGQEAGQAGSGTGGSGTKGRKRDRDKAGSGTEAGERDRVRCGTGSEVRCGTGPILEGMRDRVGSGTGRKRDRAGSGTEVPMRDRSDIAKSGDFSACPYCQ